jgi:predicted CopG family antitoxin
VARTIEIDDEAFDRLEAMRENGETLSATIKRCVPRKRTVDEILETMRSASEGISEKTLDLIEESSARRRSIPRSSRP